jgi:hypothetical protein
MRLSLAHRQEYPRVGKFDPLPREFCFNLALQSAIPIWEGIRYVFRLVIRQPPRKNTGLVSGIPGQGGA